MARLPTPGADEGNWGTILNDFLEVARCSNGELKISTWANEAARPASPEEGQVGINLETNCIERYASGSWSVIEQKYLRAGTGAVARTMSEKANDIFSVKDFGAVGDGVTDDTAAIQAAFVNWLESGALGTIYFPPGRYYITDEMTAGEATTEVYDSTQGKNVIKTQTVAKHIAQGVLNDRTSFLEKTFAVKGEYRKSVIIVGGDFQSTETLIDKVVIRYESPAKYGSGPVIEGLEFFSQCSRADRRKCPVAIKAIRINWAKISDIVVHGKEFEWSNTAIHIEEVNNSYFSNWRIKAGLQYTQADMWGNPGTFNLSATDTLESADSSSPFNNPDKEVDSFWNDKWLLLSKGATSAELMMVKTASSNAKTDANTLKLDPSYSAQTAVDGLNASFEMVRGAMSANDNTLTLNAGVLSADDEGRMVHVLKAGVNTSADRGILSAYIKKGTIVDGKSCKLVHSDDSTAANARLDIASEHVLISPPVYIGKSAELANLAGHNNDATFAAIHIEAGRGGTQLLLENVLSSNFTSGKVHGRWGHHLADQQLTECGYLVVFDHCKNLKLDNFLVSWFQGLDGQDETCYGIRIFGDRNHIKFDNYEFYGAANDTTIFDLNGLSYDCELLMGDGLNNISNWTHASNNRNLFNFNSFTSEVNIHPRGSLKVRETGSSTGFNDLLAPYKRVISGNQEVTISGGEITISGGFATVDTESSAASDDLDTINGGVPGQMLILNINTTGRSVVIKHATGNIYTASGSDVTLDASRKYALLIYDNGTFREITF